MLLNILQDTEQPTMKNYSVQNVNSFMGQKTDVSKLCTETIVTN